MLKSSKFTFAFIFATLLAISSQAAKAEFGQRAADIACSLGLAIPKTLAEFAATYQDLIQHADVSHLAQMLETGKLLDAGALVKALEEGLTSWDEPSQKFYDLEVQVRLYFDELAKRIPDKSQLRHLYVEVIEAVEARISQAFITGYFNTLAPVILNDLLTTDDVNFLSQKDFESSLLAIPSSKIPGSKAYVDLGKGPTESLLRRADVRLRALRSLHAFQILDMDAIRSDLVARLHRYQTTGQKFALLNNLAGHVIRHLEETQPPQEK